MHDHWEPCPDFPMYAISPQGEIRHIETDVVKPAHVNQRGVLYVSIYDRTTQQRVTRSVASLVARAYVPPIDRTCDTVVHLDGNRTNVAVDNLIWRTRSFAIEYHKEMNRKTRVREYPRFYCLDTQEEYHDVYAVAQSIGALPSRVSRSITFNDMIPDEVMLTTAWYSRYIVWPLGAAYRSTLVY